jgi:glutamate-1-semialdehyde aminotransferase
MPGQLLHHYLMREGVAMSAPVHLSFLSAAHTEADVDRVVDAHRVALAGMASDGVLKL